MSLINDMLRDLEARRPQGGKHTLSGVSAVKAGRRSGRRWVLAALVVALAMGAGVGLWAAYAPEPGKPTTAMRPDPAERDADPAPGAAAASDGNAGKNTAQTQEQMPVPNQAPAPSRIETARLDREQGGLALTLEANGSLPFDFQRMDSGRRLKLEFPNARLATRFPDVAGASGLVETVNARMGENGWLLDLWLVEGARAQASAGPDGRSAVLSLSAPDDRKPPAAQPRRKTAARGKEGSTPGRATVKAGGKTAQADPAGTSADSPRKTAAKGGEPVQAQASADAGFIKDRNFSSEASLTRRMNGARAALRQGHRAEAVALLRQVLDADPKRHQARDLLVRAYLDGGQVQAAMTVLERGIALGNAGGRFVVQLARLLAGSGRPDRALAVMDRHAPAQPGGEFLALTGALSQQLGHYERAAAAYRRAVAEQPGNAGWWVGLAISQEGAGRGRAALDSYRRGLQQGGLKPALEAYAKRRVEQLSGG